MHPEYSVDKDFMQLGFNHNKLRPVRGNWCKTPILELDDHL